MHGAGKVYQPFISFSVCVCDHTIFGYVIGAKVRYSICHSKRAIWVDREAREQVSLLLIAKGYDSRNCPPEPPFKLHNLVSLTMSHVSKNSHSTMQYQRST